MGHEVEVLLRVAIQGIWKGLSPDTRDIVFILALIALTIGFFNALMETIRQRNKVKIKPVEAPPTETPNKLVQLPETRERKSKFRPNVSNQLRIAILLPVILLLLAVSSTWPYNFYVILRWVVCGTTAFAITAIDRRYYLVWTIVLVVVAFVFNPISHLRLDRDTWSFLNAIAAVILCVFVAASESKNVVETKQSEINNHVR